MLYTTTGATGGSLGITFKGVTANWNSITITIIGTPTASGTFNYSIPLTGGCEATNATGTIVVRPDNSAGTPSILPTVCLNSAITDITISS